MNIKRILSFLFMLAGLGLFYLVVLSVGQKISWYFAVTTYEASLLFLGVIGLVVYVVSNNL